MACCCGIPRGLSVALSGPLPWVVWAEEEVMVALPLSSEASEWIGACRCYKFCSQFRRGSGNETSNLTTVQLLSTAYQSV